MPATVKVSFKPSFDDLSKKFQNVNIKGFFSKQVQKIGFSIEREAKRTTPVDTGRLRASIYTTISNGGLRAVIQPDTKYAFFVHEGTKYIRSRPFMYWGSERATVGLEDKMGRDLDKVIQSALR